MSSEIPEGAQPQWPGTPAENQPRQPGYGASREQQAAPPGPQRRAPMGPPPGRPHSTQGQFARPTVVGSLPAFLTQPNTQPQLPPEAQEDGLLGFGVQEDAPRKSHPIAKAVLVTTLSTLALGGGGYAADTLITGGKTFAKFGIGNAPRQHDPIVAQPSTESTPTISATTKLPTSTTTTTPTKKPTTAPAKKVLPATSLACAQALPIDIKVGQLIEPAIDANSNMAEVKAVSLKYHLGSWLVLNYPLQSDKKTPNVDSILGLKSVDKDLPTLITIDGEGGQINRLPGAAVPPGPDTLSATKLAQTSFEKQLETYYKELKSAGIDVNLAPVADIQGTSTEKTSGRLFRTPADAAKYMPSYVAAAKATGINLTFKHFPQVLEYGNTDLRPVSTPNYDVLLKNGSLDSYKLVKGTNNWVMMGSAKTTGFPNKKLDNGQIAVFNPAAYDAARQLAGDPLFITDALNGKAVNAVATQAEAAAKAISAGADKAIIVPREGKTTSDTKAAITAVEKSVKVERIDAAFLKVLGSKSVNACTLLLAKDSSYAAPKAVTAPSTPKAVTTATASPTIKDMPAVPGTKPTVTTVPATKSTVHAATEMKATATPTGKK